MKKLLISILIVLLLILTVVAMYKGIHLGGIEIIGFAQVKEKSAALDESIKRATMLASSDYKKALDDIENDIKKLDEEKKNYDDIVALSTGSQVQAANQYQKYEIEYLWTIVGNHATSEGVVLKMDVVAAGPEKHYNLNFTVSGSYIGIIDFISDIENDSVLGFKIENFSLKPGGSTSDLQAVFSCKDITITDIYEGNSATTQTNNPGTTNTTNTTNTANTTSSNTTNTSTTNSTNTTSLLTNVTN